MTPEQNAQRIDYSLTALSNGITIHKRKLHVIESAEKRAAAKIASLEKSLADERAKTVTLEQRVREAELEVDLVTRQHHAKIEGVERSIESYDRCLGDIIRKGRTKPRTETVIVRDADGRIQETITTSEDDPDVATVRRFIRRDFRVVGSETYQIPVQWEDA